jgi:copper(I)-binding protein
VKHVANLLLSVLLALAIGAQTRAQTADSKSIVVDHPWARATPGGAKTGAAYVTLINNGGVADRLLSATTPVADSVQFHSVSEEGGVSRMREMHGVEIAPGAKVTFSPGDASRTVSWAGLSCRPRSCGSRWRGPQRAYRS